MKKKVEKESRKKMSKIHNKNREKKIAKKRRLKSNILHFDSKQINFLVKWKRTKSKYNSVSKK